MNRRLRLSLPTPAQDPGLTAEALDEIELVILFELAQPALDAGRTVEGEAYLKIAELLHQRRCAALDAYMTARTAAINPPSL